MRLLVTGNEGQVARSISRRASESNGKIMVRNLARPEIDLLEHDGLREKIAATAKEFRADVIVNAAAYTAVDDAEDNEVIANAVNAEAAGIVAQAASDSQCRLIQISTDYVFDGTFDRAYREDDPVAPLGAYGRSKELGEQAVRKTGGEFAIVRTAWVYSPYGNNFLKTMLRVAEGRSTLTVVNDQFGCPTSALDIADGVLAIASSWNEGSSTGLGETYHLAGTGETHWADFARTIFKESARHGGPEAEVTGIPSSEYPTKAERPKNSRLNCDKLFRDFAFKTPDWRDRVGETVRELLAL